MQLLAKGITPSAEDAFTATPHQSRGTAPNTPPKQCHGDGGHSGVRYGRAVLEQRGLPHDCEGALPVVVCSIGDQPSRRAAEALHMSDLRELPIIG